MKKAPKSRKDILDGILKPHLLPLKTKKAIGKAIFALGSYHKEIPLSELFEILKTQGIVAVQEDYTGYCGILCGPKGSCLIELAFEYTKFKGNNDIDTYKPIKNSCLSISWYKMNTKWEVTAYVN